MAVVSCVVGSKGHRQNTLARSVIVTNLIFYSDLNMNKNGRQRVVRVRDLFGLNVVSHDCLEKSFFVAYE